MERVLRTTLVTAPELEPVGLEEVKNFLRVDHTDEDALITHLIGAARDHASSFTKRQFITATYKGYLDTFPTVSQIELPLPPLQSVTSVEYYDLDGALQTLDASTYRVYTTRERGFVELDSDYTWPLTDRRSDAVIITFICGYGDGQEDVPEAIRSAIQLLISDMFENRESFVVGTVAAKLPFTARHLLMPHTSWPVG